MKNRYKMSANRSRGAFKRGANRIHKFNLPQIKPMRGGYRL
jgi:hypothetical protein